MNKKELRKIIREEVQAEIYEILPQLLKETMTDLLAKVPKQSRPKAKQKVIKESKEEPFDRTKLASLLGYGEKPVAGRAKTPPVQTIAGIPMTGGLAAKEAEAGLSAYRDYDVSEVAEPPEMVEEEYDPQFSSIPAMPGGVDGGAEVPAALVAALGGAAKKTLDEAERKANWRPGMKRG